MQTLPRMDKNSGPVLSRLWTKVYDILRRCRRPPVVFNTLIIYVTFHFEVQAVKVAIKM